MNNPHDEIQCEDFYPDEDEPGDYFEDDVDVCDDTDDFEPDPDDDWVMTDGTTGPVGMQFLASLTPEDFV